MRKGERPPMPMRETVRAEVLAAGASSCDGGAQRAAYFDTRDHGPIYDTGLSYGLFNLRHEENFRHGASN